MAAKHALAEIIANRSHKGNLLPAFDTDGNLIAPKDYERKLCGAIVYFKIAAVFQYLSTLKMENWYAEIRELKVLDAPAPKPLSPSKRRIQEACENMLKKKKI